MTGYSDWASLLWLNVAQCVAVIPVEKEKVSCLFTQILKRVFALSLGQLTVVTLSASFSVLIFQACLQSYVLHANPEMSFLFQATCLQSSEPEFRVLALGSRKS